MPPKRSKNVAIRLTLWRKMPLKCSKNVALHGTTLMVANMHVCGTVARAYILRADTLGGSYVRNP